MMEQEQACERCGRVVPQAELSVWTESERNRVFSGLEGEPEAEASAGARPVFSYVHTDRAYKVCARCLAELTAGAPFNAPAHKRSVTMLVGIILIVVALTVITPFILPALMSALWRN
jgi:RNA polymerase subunit RPABC4/transcription elongation factor Spt4